MKHPERANQSKFEFDPLTERSRGPFRPEEEVMFYEVINLINRRDDTANNSPSNGSLHATLFYFLFY